VSNVEVFKKKPDRLPVRKEADVLTVPQRTKKVRGEKSARTLTKANVMAMEELALILKPIYRRMLKEGWIMKDGKLVKSDDS
jgi:hypothetical protein